MKLRRKDISQKKNQRDTRDKQQLCVNSIEVNERENNFIVKMDIKSALLWGKNNLFSDTRILDSEVLLSHTIKKSREYLLMNPSIILTPGEERVYKNLIKRRGKGEPVAYLIGEKEFFGLNFGVSKDCLIPRPETELLCEEAIRIVKKEFSHEVEICDIGTGSGAIGVSLAVMLKNAHITATDISKKALKIAKENAARNGVEKRIKFINCDLMPKSKFDLLAANLPYLVEDDPSVSSEVKKYEPHRALFAKENGLFLYKKLFKKIAENKIFPKYLLFEFGFNQAKSIKELLNKYFVHEGGVKPEITLAKDLSGILRIFIVKFKTC